MKKKQKIKEVIPTVVIEPKKLTIKSAGIVDGKFQVLLSNGDYLDDVTKVSTQPVGYGNSMFIDISLVTKETKVQITEPAFVEKDGKQVLNPKGNFATFPTNGK